MKTVKLVLSILIGVFVFFSLIPYGERTNPEVDEKLTLHAPEDVLKPLKRSCYDCHSNQTRWPWYSYVFPLAWSVKDHVKNGRAALNFDKWYAYSEEKRQELKNDIYNKTGVTMPLKQYVWFHKEAKLSKDEIEKIKNWAMSE